MGKGGVRQGAGRPKGEGTKQMRIPLGLIDLVRNLIKEFKTMKYEFYQMGDDSMESMKNGCIYVAKGAHLWTVEPEGDLNGKLVVASNGQDFLIRKLEGGNLLASNPKYAPVELANDWTVIKQVARVDTLLN